MILKKNPVVSGENHGNNEEEGNEQVNKASFQLCHQNKRMLYPEKHETKMHECNKLSMKMYRFILPSFFCFS